MSPASRRGRNSRLKGQKGERDFLKLCKEEDLPIKKVARSGALKNYGGELIGGAENYAGDMILTVGDVKYRIEVKVGGQVPKLIGEKMPDGIEGFCRLYTFGKFIAFLHFGVENLLEPNLVPDKRVQKLHDFFDQDDCAIVAMSPQGTSAWYIAVKNEYLNELGGKI